LKHWKFGQLPGHLVRALNNTLTRTEASEPISHLAYYGGGWPSAFSAAAIDRTVFEQRKAQK
jgi:4-carboxymuconolactone decarboxylase